MSRSFLTPPFRPLYIQPDSIARKLKAGFIVPLFKKIGKSRKN
jgi:hypothetical protein